MTRPKYPHFRHDDILPDYHLVAMHDPAGRRGLWFRTDAEEMWSDEGADSRRTLTASFVEVRAGREGDSAGVMIRAGDVVTNETLLALAEVLGCARGAREVGAQRHEQWRLRKRISEHRRRR